MVLHTGSRRDTIMTTEAFRAPTGRVSAIHLIADVTGPRPEWSTLCGRPAGDMTLMPSDPWSAMGFRAASESGPCCRCSRKA